MRYSEEDVQQDNRIGYAPKLVIFGTGSNAEMAIDYFENESNYDIC